MKSAPRWPAILVTCGLGVSGFGCVEFSYEGAACDPPESGGDAGQCPRKLTCFEGRCRNPADFGWCTPLAHDAGGPYLEQRSDDGGVQLYALAPGGGVPATAVATGALPEGGGMRTVLFVAMPPNAEQGVGVRVLTRSDDGSRLVNCAQFPLPPELAGGLIKLSFAEAERALYALAAGDAVLSGRRLLKVSLIQTPDGVRPVDPIVVSPQPGGVCGSVQDFVTYQPPSSAGGSPGPPFIGLSCGLPQPSTPASLVVLPTSALRGFADTRGGGFVLDGGTPYLPAALGDRLLTPALVDSMNPAVAAAGFFAFSSSSDGGSTLWPVLGDAARGAGTVVTTAASVGKVLTAFPSLSSPADPAHLVMLGRPESANAEVTGVEVAQVEGKWATVASVTMTGTDPCPGVRPRAVASQLPDGQLAPGGTLMDVLTCRQATAAGVPRQGQLVLQRWTLTGDPASSRWNVQETSLGLLFTPRDEIPPPDIATAHGLLSKESGRFASSWSLVATTGTGSPTLAVVY